MLNFVPGDVLETRRGGVDVLRHLAQELALLQRDGSIQIQRNIPDVGKREGHLLIFDGSLAAAFHEAETSRFGIEALLEIESDASALDATMSLHEMSESAYIDAISGNPLANLLNPEENDRDEAWWATVRTPVRRLDREERLPEVKPSVGIPEALRRRSEARMKMQSGPVLQRGQAWLEHSIEPDDAFHFARKISEFNQSLLIISRQSPPQLESNYNIDLQYYRWLSETQHERTLEPSLESIRRTIDQFVVEHQKSILILEGIEYLSGIHGEQRVIEMIRSIVDQTRANGNVLLVSSNLEAFTSHQRSRLQREFTMLDSTQIKTWLLDIELLMDHPFFNTIDEEAEVAIAQHLEEHVSDPVLTPRPETNTPVEQIPLPIEHQTKQIDDDLRSKMIEWANESDEEKPSEEVNTVEEIETVVEKAAPTVKPRTAQRVIRKKRTVRKTLTRNAIDAAVQRNIVLPSIGIKPAHASKPFVPVQPEVEHAFPKGKRPMTQNQTLNAVANSMKREPAEFPPIKSTGHVPVRKTRSSPSIQNVKPSQHAREHARSTQRQTKEDDSEGDE